MAKQRKDFRELTVCETCGYNCSRVPGIRIQGRWLAELGFEPGDAVLVQCEDGRIVITKDEALAARKAAEKAFMETELQNLEKRYEEEKERLRGLYVAEQKGRYNA